MEADTRTLRNTPRYKGMRRAYLNENPLCAECQRQGFTVGADELDHIVPVAQAPDRFWDRENLQGLCRACHEEKTKMENSPATVVEGYDDWQALASRMD